MSRVISLKGSRKFQIAAALLFVSIVASGCSLFFPTHKIKFINYPVERGDTLHDLSVRFGVSMSEIARINDLDNPNVLEVGTILKIPLPGQKLLKARGGNGVNPKDIAPDQESLKKVKLNEARRYIGQLSWPIPGAGVTSKFGWRWASFHEGIDIHADEGTPVHAAHDGQVVYADDRIHGYGNLVIIRGSGLITVYAHNSDMRVSKGEYVKRGEVISISGSTGSVSGPHLHFETRIKDEKGLNAAIDPLTFYH